MEINSPFLRTAIQKGSLGLMIIGLLGVTAAALRRTALMPPRYDIRVRSEPGDGLLSVDLDVTLPPVSEDRRVLQFKLLQSMGTPQVDLISPATLGTLSVRNVKREADELKPTATWEIAASRRFPPHLPISLHITLKGGQGGALVNYIGPDFIIASGLVQPWFPQFSDKKVIGSLKLDLPSNFLAVGSGEKVSDQVLAGRRTVEFRLVTPTRIDFAAGPFKVINAPQKPGEIPISLYLLRDRDFSSDLIDIVHRSFSVLEREFGPAPVKQFAVVEFPTEAGMKASISGASQDGYILMRTDDLDRMRADPRSSYFGHEIGHQWWGVSVSYPGGDGGDFMLDEALAEYGAIKVNEALRGADGAKVFRDDAREKVLRRIAAGYDGPIARIPAAPPGGSSFFYQDIVRSKGALVYNVISSAIGPDRMRRFFHTITREFAHSSDITWHAFVARLKQAAGPGKQWVIDQWLNQPGLPVLDLNWTTENRRLMVRIGQHEPRMPPFRLLMPIRIDYADGSTETRGVDVAARPQTEAVFQARKVISRVELDPQRSLPWVTPKEFAAAVAIKDFTLAWQFWNYEGKTAEAEQILKAALNARTGSDATPAEFLERYQYGWLLEDAGKLPEALAQYKLALELPVRPEGQNRVHLIQNYVNIARVSSKMGDKAQAKWAALGAIALIDAGEEDSFTRRTKVEAQKYLK